MSKEDYLKEELAALDLAINNEKKVRAFYLENADKINNSLAEKAFIFLADEELKHIDEISAFFKSITDGNVPEIEQGPDDEALDKTKEFFSVNMKNAAKEAADAEDDIKIYDLGLDIETKGYNFYKEEAEKAKHPNVKKLFEFLMKEENAHYQLLSNIRDYLSDPAGWHQDQEQWLFEG